jgi:hypothetical protein
MLLIGGSYALFAQDVRSTNDSNIQKNTDTSINGQSRDTSYNSNTGRQNNKMYNSRDSMNNRNGSSGSMNNNNWNNNSNGSQNYNQNNNSSSGNLMNSNNSYNAYGTDIPYNVRSSFNRDYQGSDNVKWQQSNEWWHASYSNNGQNYNRYYNAKGQSYSVALPVIETQVPTDVASKISSMYGPAVYDITKVKGYNNQDMYVVRILDNGQIRTERINEDGTQYKDSISTGMNNGEQSGNTGTWNNNQNTQSNSQTAISGSTDTTINGNNSTGNSAAGTTNSNTTSDMTTTSDNSSSSGVDVNGNTNKGKTKWKSKTINSDGKKTIIKTKNGKTTNKTSNTQNQDQ